MIPPINSNPRCPPITPGQNNPPAGISNGQVITQFEARQLAQPKPILHNPHCLPFLNADTFSHSFSLLGYGGIFLCARVCKLWNEHSEKLPWQQFSENEGLLLIEEGKETNRKEEFRVLYPMTINLRMIEEVFGRVAGKIPCMRRDIFNKCYEQDPFEPSTDPLKPLLMMHTFKVVVIPAFIERTSGPDFSFALDEKGDLQPVEPGKVIGEKLQIPLGIYNLKILCENPLAGKENGPVFSYFRLEILDQCNTLPVKMRVCFMRKCIAPGSRNQSYSAQKALVKSHGFGVTSLIERVFFNAVGILKFGTCQDGQNPLTYARTSDSITILSAFPIAIAGSKHELVVGGFALRKGADVSNSGYVHDSIGVAPGVSAEGSAT